MRKGVLVFTFIIFIVGISFSHPLDFLLAKRGAPEYETILSTTIEHGERIWVLKSYGMNWQGIQWFHRVGIYIPQKLSFKDRAFVLVTGGSRYVENRSYYESMMKKIAKYRWIAKAFDAPFIIVSDVPNQPIWGLKEDNLIAETFQRFIETGDETLPLLIPMNYGVVKAMDAAQDLLKKNGIDVKYFMVSGASKRGWTTYLTAVFDSRVFAIAPMVYDNLNLAKQMEHQLQMYGTYSEKIAPYTEKNLPSTLSSEEGKKLVEIVDPFSFRLRLSLPKLLIFGTNDRYWTVDSANLYVDSLPGDTYLFYSPNDGHDIKKVNTASALFKLWPEKKFPNPHFIYDKGKICIKFQPGLVSIELWQARSKTKDFRNSIWIRKPGRQLEELFCAFADETDINTAYFARVLYNIDGFRFYLSSRIVVSFH